MEDVVAVELKTPEGGPYFVVTYGRVQDPVEPSAVEEIVLGHASKFGLGHATEARVCWSLQEARDAVYFYEALIDFGAKLAEARTEDYPAWRERTNSEMRNGRHLWFLGHPRPIL